MRRIPSLHALPALVVAAASLAIPFLGQDDGARYSAADTSAIKVTAKAASASPDQQFPVGGPAIETAKQVARAHWGSDACGGNVAMGWTVMEPGTNATASWRNPTDAWNNAGANFDCKIDINAQATYDFAKLCTVLTHELGHLLGHQHTEQPGQLMSAYYTDPLPQCTAADPNPPAAQPLEELDGEPADTTVQSASTKKQQLRSSAAAKKAAAKKAAAKKAAKKATKKAAKRRCVVRFKAGKRVKRCATVKPTAKRASKKPARAQRA